MSEEISGVQSETTSAESAEREPTPEEVDLFFRLYLPEAETVGAYVTSKIGPHHSEDILHDAVCAGVKNIHQLEDPENDFIKWFYGVIGNTIALYWRDKRTEERVTLNYLEQSKQMDEESIMEQNPENTLLKEERSRMAYEALGALPEDLRTAFSLREGQGLSYQEIAERTGVHENTVKNRVVKAKKLLSLRTQQMVVVGIMDFVRSERMRAASMRALQDILESANIPPDAVHIAGLTTAGAVGATGSASASGGAGVSGATGVFSLSGVLLMCGSLFFWMMSVLIGAHAYGAAMIQSARTLQVRRWLVKHLVYSYCGLIIAFTIFMIPLILNIFSNESLALFHRLFKWGFLLSVSAYLVWLRVRYARINKSLESDPTVFNDTEIDHSFTTLRRIVCVGFILTTACIAALLIGVVFALLPDLSLAFATDRSFLACTIIFLFAFPLIVIGLFHAGTFYLFRHYLSSANTLADADSIPISRGKFRFRNDRWTVNGIGLTLSVLITVSLSLLHMTIIRTKPIIAVSELIVFGTMWFAVWFWIKKQGRYGSILILITLIGQCLAVLLLRDLIWK